ncbi:hypothetical protein, partial [Testudinibacter sp. TR-2022]|uniref:hypothetical protein n=1 Tax=Testudinibacter sp. TR-2022 TaxID=2585029 RepID=UPI0022778557
DIELQGNTWETGVVIGRGINSIGNSEASDSRRPIIDITEGYHTESVTVNGKVIYRSDDNFYSNINNKGKIKAYIDASGDLLSANISGSVTITQHIRGASPLKEQSQYISFSGNNKGKKYGDNTISVALDNLKNDVSSGKLKGIEVIENQDVVSYLKNKSSIKFDSYSKNPTRNTRYEFIRSRQDLNNAKR